MDESSSTSQNRESSWSDDSTMVEWLKDDTTAGCCPCDGWNGPRIAHPKIVFQAVGVSLGLETMFFPFQNLLFSISCFHDSASKHVFPEFTSFITFHSLKYR